MKTIVKILSIAIFGVSCAGSAQLGTSYNDDLYYSPSENANQQSNVPKNNPDPQNQLANFEKPLPVQENVNPEISSDRLFTTQDFIPTESFDTNSNAAANRENYSEYNEDDYYDYEYAARLRRFHDPYNSWGYYDPYYTNLYWYTGFPSDFGWSIYLGYNWWWGTPWYSPWYHSYANSWYDPYYSFYSPFSYWNGFNDGYWLGYYHSPYYYNSYDDNGIPAVSSSRGHRNGFSTGGTLASGTRTRAGTRESFVEKYDLKKNEIRSSLNTNGNSISGEKGRRVKISNNGTIVHENNAAIGNRSASQKLVEQSSVKIEPNPSNVNPSVSSRNRNSYPAGNNANQGNNAKTSKDNPQNYTPSYSVPRNNGRTSYNSNQSSSYEKNNQSQGSAVSPSGNQRKPANSYNNSSSPSYTAPRNHSNQNYSAPKSSNSNSGNRSNSNSGSKSSGSNTRKRGN